MDSLASQPQENLRQRDRDLRRPDPLDLTGLTAIQRKKAARLASQPPSRQSESKTQAARLSLPPQKTELRGTFKTANRVQNL